MPATETWDFAGDSWWEVLKIKFSPKDFDLHREYHATLFIGSHLLQHCCAAFHFATSNRSPVSYYLFARLISWLYILWLVDICHVWFLTTGPSCVWMISDAIRVFWMLIIWQHLLLLFHDTLRKGSIIVCLRQHLGVDKSAQDCLIWDPSNVQLNKSQSAIPKVGRPLMGRSLNMTETSVLCVVCTELFDLF